MLFRLTKRLRSSSLRPVPCGEFSPHVSRTQAKFTFDLEYFAAPAEMQFVSFCLRIYGLLLICLRPRWSTLREIYVTVSSDFTAPSNWLGLWWNLTVSYVIDYVIAVIIFCASTIRARRGFLIARRLVNMIMRSLLERFFLLFHLNFTRCGSKWLNGLNVRPWTKIIQCNDMICPGNR